MYLIQMTITSTIVGKNLIRNGVAFIVNKRVQNAIPRCNLKNNKMISVIPKANHSAFKSMPQPLMLKKLKLPVL